MKRTSGFGITRLFPFGAFSMSTACDQTAAADTEATEVSPSAGVMVGGGGGDAGRWPGDCNAGTGLTSDQHRARAHWPVVPTLSWCSDTDGCTHPAVAGHQHSSDVAAPAGA